MRPLRPRGSCRGPSITSELRAFFFLLKLLCLKWWWIMPSPRSCVQPLTSFSYRKSLLLLVYILIYFMLGSNLLLWEDAVVNLGFAFFSWQGFINSRKGMGLSFSSVTSWASSGSSTFRLLFFAEDRLVPARRSSRVSKLLPTKFLAQCLMC